MSNRRQFVGLPYFQSKNTQTTVASTTSETTLWSFTLPANTLRANGGILVDMYGTLLGNSGTGAGHDMTFRIKFGASTILQALWAVPSTNATGRPWWSRFVVKNAGGTGNQNISAFWVVDDQIGSANFSTSTGSTATRSGAYAVDTTADVTVAVTAQPGTSSANLNAVLMAGTALLVR